LARFRRTRLHRSRGVKVEAAAEGSLIVRVELVYGAGKNDRRLPDAEALRREWREKEKDWGQL
jgi:hypothetical protein